MSAHHAADITPEQVAAVQRAYKNTSRYSVSLGVGLTDMEARLIAKAVLDAKLVPGAPK